MKTSLSLKGRSGKIIILLILVVLSALVAGIYYYNKKLECQPRYVGLVKLRPDLNNTKFTTDGVFNTTFTNRFGTSIELLDVDVKNIVLNTTCSKDVKINNQNYRFPIPINQVKDHPVFKMGEMFLVSLTSCDGNSKANENDKFRVNVTVKFTTVVDSGPVHTEKGMIEGCYEK